MSTVVALVIGLMFGGCAHVAPYEREALACDCMTSPRTEPYDSFEAHVRSAREGASATSWSAGGGCGCN